MGNAKPRSNETRHIIMFTHNGFGNQLYQIAFG